MTVLRNLPDQLILAHAPWLFGGALIACIIAACGAGLTLLFAGEWSGLAALLIGGGLPLAIFALAIQRDQVIFDTATGTITLQRQTLWRYTRAVHALDDLVRADLQELRETARPVLILRQGGQRRTHPLIEPYIGGNAPRKTVRVINDWHDATRSRRRRTPPRA